MLTLAGTNMIKLEFQWRPRLLAICDMVTHRWNTFPLYVIWLLTAGISFFSLGYAFIDSFFLKKR